MVAGPRSVVARAGAIVAVSGTPNAAWITANVVSCGSVGIQGEAA